MAHRQLAVALVMVAAAWPAGATGTDPAPTAAPEGTAQTRYCMRVEASTGSRVERVRCWTRREWAEQGVDVTREWPREGVRIIG